MSPWEQKIEQIDKNYQYLLFAADPYETIAFKIPNLEIENGEGDHLILNKIHNYEVII
jgi:splicing factor 3A subunit 2